MNIVLVHNHYQQPGGEDRVFALEGELLESHGHHVVRYTVHNDAVADASQLTLAASAIWNRAAYRDLRAVLREQRPDVVHVHNTLPLLSPAALSAARAEGAAVVQTLHNFRLVCPSGLLFRNGALCHDCVGKAVPWPGVLHGCYRGSRPATAVIGTMLAFHKARGTFRHDVDRYIALTEHSRELFIQGGLSPERVVVKPNFVLDDPGVGTGTGGYALFVGRLAEEKGLRVLLDAWRDVGPELPLRIVGDGPMTAEVRHIAAGLSGVTVVGRLPSSRIVEEMRDAAVVVMPSVWYETFGLVAVEAFSVGTPVVASDLGAMSELVEHEVNGLLFRAGDAKSLATAVKWVVINPERIGAIRRAARAKYLQTYSADANYRLLMQVYAQALETRDAAT